MIERNMSKYKIYSATKGKKEDSLLYKSLSIDYYDIPTLYKENNTQSLQKTYNEFLDDAYDNDVDIACFIHDDVFVSCKVKEPALWHLMSGREDHRGNVAHGDQTSYSYTSFGPLPSRALVLDGVFLGININKFNKKARFDETYPSQFHYYDIDFCLECNKNGIIMGVVDIPIIHSSPGLTDPNKQFYEGQKYFINKWKK